MEHIAQGKRSDTLGITCWSSRALKGQKPSSLTTYTSSHSTPYDNKNCLYSSWNENRLYMHMVVNTTNPYDIAASSVYKLADIAMYTLNDCAMS